MKATRIWPNFKSISSCGEEFFSDFTKNSPLRSGFAVASEVSRMPYLSKARSVLHRKSYSIRSKPMRNNVDLLELIVGLTMVWKA